MNDAGERSKVYMVSIIHTGIRTQAKKVNVKSTNAKSLWCHVVELYFKMLDMRALSETLGVKNQSHLRIADCMSRQEVKNVFGLCPTTGKRQ